MRTENWRILCANCPSSQLQVAAHRLSNSSRPKPIHPVHPRARDINPLNSHHIYYNTHGYAFTRWYIIIWCIIKSYKLNQVTNLECNAVITNRRHALVINLRNSYGVFFEILKTSSSHRWYASNLVPWSRYVGTLSTISSPCSFVPLLRHHTTRWWWPRRHDSCMSLSHPPWTNVLVAL